MPRPKGPVVGSRRWRQIHGEGAPPEAAGVPVEPKEAPVVVTRADKIAELEGEVARLKRELAKRGHETTPPGRGASWPMSLKPDKPQRGNGTNKGQVIEHGAACQCLGCRAGG